MQPPAFRYTCASAPCRSASCVASMRGSTAGGRPSLAIRTDLARVLLHDPRQPPGSRRARLPARVRRAALRWQRGILARPGATVAPAIPWSTPPCASSSRPAPCTTVCAWSRRLSSSRTSASTGGAASASSPHKLNDYDLAANNGGWQWAASTGCDAQPWFRIFNPVTQSRKFDPQGEFIRRYVPELARVTASPSCMRPGPWTRPFSGPAASCLGCDYPLPVVDHAEARERTLSRYGAIRGG